MKAPTHANNGSNGAIDFKSVFERLSEELSKLGEAHGIDWLEQFFRDNEREISKYY